MWCGSCSNPVEDGARFCGVCGAATTAPTAVLPSTPGPLPPPVVPTPPGRRPTWWPLVVIALVGVLAAVVGLVLAGGSDDTRTASGVTTPAPLTNPTTAPPTTTPTTKPTTTTSTTTTTTTSTTTTTTSTTTTTLPPAVAHPYFAALARWNESGAVDMLGFSPVGSPAWNYGRHLQQGFRAGASPSGIASITATGPDSGRLCIGTTCNVITGITFDGDAVGSFALDGIDIMNRSAAWRLGEIATCWYWGADQGCPGSNAITMNLTSIFRVPGSTYVSIEVEVGSGTGGSVEFDSMSVWDSTGRHTERTEVVRSVGPGDRAVWMLVTDDLAVTDVTEVTIGAWTSDGYFEWVLEPGGTAAPPGGEQGARSDIESLVRGDRSTLGDLVGWYVPQLSAKQYDWYEPNTGVYYDWSGILADHLSFRNRWHGAILMAPDEYSDSASPWFRTLVPVGRSDEPGVRSWCESNGYVWGVTCIARRVDPF